MNSQKMSSGNNQTGGRIAFQYRDFRLYLFARFLSLTAHQILIVAISQAVYEVTRDPLHLGYIGLSLFLPKMSFSLLAGHAADRFDRRKVILFCRGSQFLVIISLILFGFLGLKPIAVLYLLLFLLGTAYAFDGPSSQAILTQLIPIEHLNNAVAWNSSTMQIAFIFGPALGGWLYAIFGGVIPPLIFIALLRAISFLMILSLKSYPLLRQGSELSLDTLFAGLRYVFQNRILLGAISLDLFAVLFGGAVALMPVFADQILKVGPLGNGILRAAPAAGAALMAIALAHLPPLKRAGSTLFVAVAIFGIATILFGISKNFYFSIICLFVLGAADMISVVIRGVLVQVKTPPEMRGRVSAVNLIFIGASNELGEFETGVMARYLGVVPSVVVGGVGTLLVVGLWRVLFPQFKEFKRLDETIEA